MSIFSTDDCAFVSHNKTLMQLFPHSLLLCFSSVFFYYFTALLRNISFLLLPAQETSVEIPDVPSGTTEQCCRKEKALLLLWHFCNYLLLLI